MKTRILTAATLALAAAATPAAHAADEFSFQYAFEREQLQTEEGAAAVLDDLTDQIKRRCSVGAFPSRLANRKLVRTCTADSLERAVTMINAPMLSKVHEDRKAETG